MRINLRCTILGAGINLTLQVIVTSEELKVIVANEK